jgi:hypothetical protein
MTTLRSCALLACAATLCAASDGIRVQFVGGTVTEVPVKSSARLDITGRQTLVFHAGKSDLTIPYDKINIIEYGQNVSRRFAAAVLISPILLLSKSRKHFVTLEYVDAGGKQQALVFRAPKGDIRGLLAGLEARTGRRIEFQDDEARKSGKG